MGQDASQNQSPNKRGVYICQRFRSWLKPRRWAFSLALVLSAQEIICATQLSQLFFLTCELMVKVDSAWKVDARMEMKTRMTMK